MQAIWTTTTSATMLVAGWRLSQRSRAARPPAAAGARRPPAGPRRAPASRTRTGSGTAATSPRRGSAVGAGPLLHDAGGGLVDHRAADRHADRRNAVLRVVIQHDDRHV